MVTKTFDTTKFIYGIKWNLTNKGNWDVKFNLSNGNYININPLHSTRSVSGSAYNPSRVGWYYIGNNTYISLIWNDTDKRINVASYAKFNGIAGNNPGSFVSGHVHVLVIDDD